MIHRKRAVDAKKLRKYAVILLLALLVVALSGCVEEGDKGSSVVEDLGEPIDEVTNYVGTEGFGIEGDVQEKLEGEGSLYALVKEETGEESSGPEIQHLAKFAELTYLDENGNEIEKYQINGKPVDLSGDEVEQLKTHSVEKDLIIPLLKDLGGGKYDCQALVQSTEACGWEYDDLYQYENIMDSKKPYIITGIIPVGDEYQEIVIFNEAFFKGKEMCDYLGLAGELEDIEDLDDFEWTDKFDLVDIPGVSTYKKLAPDVYYQRREPFKYMEVEDIIHGSSDKKQAHA